MCWSQEIQNMFRSQHLGGRGIATFIRTLRRVQVVYVFSKLMLLIYKTDEEWPLDIRT